MKETGTPLPDSDDVVWLTYRDAERRLSIAGRTLSRRIERLRWPTREENREWSVAVPRAVLIARHQRLAAQARAVLEGLADAVLEDQEEATGAGEAGDSLVLAQQAPLGAAITTRDEQSVAIAERVDRLEAEVERLRAELEARHAAEQRGALAAEAASWRQRFEELSAQVTRRPCWPYPGCMAR